MLSFQTIVSSLVLAGSAAATTYKIEVGNGGLTFSPNSTVAAVGDVLEFVFFAKNHSVVQSTFTNPCQSQTGFFSGFMPVASGQGSSTFRVTVNDTKPIWFYCSQPGAGGHCAKGMVGCANCPTTGNTLAAFAQAAAKTTNNTVTQPAVIGGGIIAAAGSSSNGQGSSSSSVATITTTLAAGGYSSTTSSGSMRTSSAMTTSRAATSSSPTPSASGTGSGATGDAASNDKWSVLTIAAAMGGLAMMMV